MSDRLRPLRSPAVMALFGSRQQQPRLEFSQLLSFGCASSQLAGSSPVADANGAPRRRWPEQCAPRPGAFGAESDCLVIGSELLITYL